MGSSRALVCSTAFVLVLLSSASKDERSHQQQRDITFDLGRIRQEMQEPLPPELVMQTEMDLSDLLDPKEFFTEQKIVSPPDLFDGLTQRESHRPGFSPPKRRKPGFMPRSFGGSPVEDYYVQFPLAQPSSDNLQAICLHGDQRPSYSDSYFPNSGYGQQRRRATAVNNAESWFRTCCKGNETWGSDVTLCCATQAWELSVDSFCEEEFSVKDRHYDCCKLTGSARLNCFHDDAPNPSYGPTEELPVPPLPATTGFSFDPSTCQRTVMTPYSVKGKKKKKVKQPSTSLKVDINFPPGRPTTDNIESLCNNQRLRPIYTVKCLPGSGYESVAHQVKSINRIEKGFKQCCKKKQDVLKCAEQKWREELNKFCVGENGGQVDFHCCSAGDGTNDRYDCFQNAASDPHYNMTSAAEKPSLSKICNTHKIIKKKFPVGFPLKSFVIQCCPLPEEDKAACAVQRLQEMSEKLCSSRRAFPPAVRRCCRASSEEAQQCISKILMDAITKATNLSRQKKKKRCPLS